MKIEYLKPYKGRIENWAKRICNPELGLGFYIIGRFVDHPKFARENGHTSWVVKYDEKTGEIEIRNSRYTLV